MCNVHGAARPLLAPGLTIGQPRLHLHFTINFPLPSLVTSLLSDFLDALNVR
ncbi:hypothetical protein J6590_057739, partial [Homalodisca vitripennis]